MVLTEEFDLHTWVDKAKADPERGTPDHEVWFIEYRGEVVGFQDVLDFYEELGHIRETKEWSEEWLT